MWPITFAVLLICHHLSPACSTRLPLEVYELKTTTGTTAAAAAAAAAAAGAAVEHNKHSSNSNSNSNSNSSKSNIANNLHLKHKNLEYATVNAQTATLNVAIANTNQSDDTITDLHYLDMQQQQQHQQEQSQHQHQHQHQQTEKSAQNRQQILEQRRSRQMLQLMEQQQQQQQQQHRYLYDPLQQQKQTKSAYLHGESQKRAHDTLPQDVRILYQVGDSEADLPICAPNAVCSKIDLYETPWIERQCRCPELNRQPQHIILHHHHQHSSSSNSASNNQKDLQQDNNAHEKFRSYYEREKLLQHKRLLVSGDYSDKKFESLHLKKLMQRLGAVYEEDLQLQPSDYENDALQQQQQQLSVELSNNEFPMRRSGYYNVEPSTTHMRHSGHGSSNNGGVGHRARAPLTLIGGCPSGLGIEDGHTIADKTRHYKLCQPVHKLPVCKHFRDYTWTLTTSAELNVTEQIVHCRCPKNSVTYLTKREPAVDGASGYAYLFACSPLTRLRCQRKQPCKLFTVRKRQEFLDEVNINALCQCPKGHRCPSHHTQSGVIPGESFLEDNIQTYSGYCMTND